MKITFHPTPFESLRPQVEAHIRSLPSATDSFLESHIIHSNFYTILVEGQEAGYTAVHNKNRITQFVLNPEFRFLGQRLFSQVCRLEEVQSAFVPTYDEFYLSHALDQYRELHKQAYFFAWSGGKENAADASFNLITAQPHDKAQIIKESDSFFDDLDHSLAKEEIFLILQGKELVAFGIIEKSVLQKEIASVGMFVLESQRQKGVGTATLRLLQDHCAQHDIIPIAGCWYYNHNSKKTLEKAGFYAASRLLRIDY